MFKAAITRLTALAKGGGGGGQLPPVPPPKTTNKQQSYPAYVTSIRPNPAILQKRDPQLANLDITQTYRFGASTAEVMRNLARAQPDLSAAISSYLRVGIPEKYIAIARDPDGTVNDDACRLAFEILQRFDKLPAYDAGFSQVASIRSTAEALAKEGLMYGAMSMELVLDKGRLPYTFSPIFVPSIKFYEDQQGAAKGLKPVQDVGGTFIDLDIPTFFMVWLDPILNDPYPQSPFDAAIQPVLMAAQFLADLRRVMVRHVYPRYDVTIKEEELKKAIPPDILQDPEALPKWLNERFAEVETLINSVGPEEALIHYDFIEIKFVEGDDGSGVAEKFTVVKDIIDANLAKGAKVMPAVLGNGSGSQNVASTETLLFMLSANSLIRMKLQELFSRALTLAVRLFGLDVTVSFEFDEIELRPGTELAAFNTMEFERLCKMWGLGVIGDMEFCLRVNHSPMPANFTSQSGTLTLQDILSIAPTDPAGNSYSGTGAGGGQSGGSAATQSRTPKTPQKAKGNPK